jgi:hypothetical protein
MAGALKLFPGAFREFFLQEEAQRAVSSRTADQRALIRNFVTAADARLAAAESLTGGDQVPAALILYREGIICTVRALLESRGRDSSASSVDDALSSLVAMIDAGEVPPAPEGFESARSLLVDQRPLAFDELPPGEAMAKRSQVEITALWLRGLVDPRSLRQIKWARAMRLGTVGIVVLALLGVGIAKLSAPKNIALGKPVTISSRRPQCPAGTGEAGLPPSGLVDGNISSTYDICTNFEVRPWVTVDLQQSRHISKIVAYYRGDCCQGLYDLPAVLEISEDGTNFREVARRTTAYSASDPWTTKLDGTSARFVRVRVDSNESKELVMTELEVYARF